MSAAHLPLLHLSAGKYAAFLWPAWGISTLVVAAMVADTLTRARRWRRPGPAPPRSAAVKLWVAALPLAVLSALGILFATFGLHHDPTFLPDAMVGQKAPPETLPPLRGGPRTALESQLRGPTLVNFFASWCLPCAEEAPALLAMKSEGVRMIGIAYEDDPKNSRAFLDRLGDPFTAVLVDRDGRAGIDFGVSGVPETFLVGSDGVILTKHSGPLSPADAESLLEHAAKSAAHGTRSRT